MYEELITPAVVAVLAFVVKYVRDYIKTLLTPRRMQTLLGMARTVVSAADEVGNYLELGPAEKYAYAETALTALAKRLGIRLKPEEANALISAILADDHFAEAIALNNEPEGGEDLSAIAA